MFCYLVKVNGGDEGFDWVIWCLENSGYIVVIVYLEGEVEFVLYQYQEEQGIDLIVMGVYGYFRICEWLIGSIIDCMFCNVRVFYLILR